jgi:hypothetical protein
MIIIKIMRDKNDIGLEWLSVGLDHSSPSQLLQSTASWLFKYIYLGKDRRNIVVGENAALGSAVHNAIQNVLCGIPLYDATREAQIEFDMHDANEDAAKRIKYRGIIPQMVQNGVDILLENGFFAAIPEEKITTRFDDVNVDIIGYVDLVVPKTIFCEMKTKAPRKTRLLKDGSQGWSKGTLPKTPEKNHVMQSAIYHHALKITPSICYINEAEAVLFTPFNCDELKADNLTKCLEEMRQKALVRQNLLKVSDDPKVLASIVDPDWDHPYQWKLDNEYLQKARKLWEF